MIRKILEAIDHWVGRFAAWALPPHQRRIGTFDTQEEAREAAEAFSAKQASLKKPRKIEWEIRKMGKVVDGRITYEVVDRSSGIDEKLELTPARGFKPKPSGAWVDEFGAEYDVPKEILNHPMMEDQSWHNDISPSFGLYDDSHGIDVRLWVDHPDPEQSEYGPADPASYERFSVSASFHGIAPDDSDDFEPKEVVDEGYQTADVNEAIRVWEKAAKYFLGGTPVWQRKTGSE